MVGDDHSRISAASKLASREIGCKVFRGSPYYRKEGQPCSGSAMLATCAPLMALPLS